MAVIFPSLFDLTLVKIAQSRRHYVLSRAIKCIGQSLSIISDIHEFHFEVKIDAPGKEPHGECEHLSGFDPIYSAQ